MKTKLLLPLGFFTTAILWFWLALPPANPVPQNVVQFTSGGHVLGFADKSVYVASGSHALHVTFVNANPVKPVGAAQPNSQRAEALSRIEYSNLWDGITLKYDAPRGAIARSTYRIEPNANPDNIRLRYNAPVSVQGDGSLRISFKTGRLNESTPRAWQERDGNRLPVKIAFAPVGENEIRFSVGDYDRTRALFIDPTLTWNTFLGGSGDDEAHRLALDSLGNIDVVGTSSGTWGSPVRAFGADLRAAFVAQLDSNGNLKWNTFLGSAVGGCCPGDTEGFGIGVDVIGNIYVSGGSGSSWGSPVRSHDPNSRDAFVAKLDSSGNLIWNTFVGGSGDDFGTAVGVDTTGNIVVTGSSQITWGSPVRAFSGSNFDSFAAKLDSSGNLIWNTFLGGNSVAGAAYVAVDALTNIYVVGASNVTWGSPVRAFGGGVSDAWAAKLNPLGILLWNTFLGGTGSDGPDSVATDTSGNIYVGGTSDATWGSPVAPFNGGRDAFVARLDSNGNLIWNTFLGGNGDNAASGTTVSTDDSGNIDVVGASNVSWGSPARPFSSAYDAYAAQLDANGNLIWNTFLGGPGDDGAQGVAADHSGNVYVAGSSHATWGSPVRSFSSPRDAFVAQLSGAAATPTPTPTPFPGGGNFVVGDRNAVVGNHVTFWGAQWAKENSLSGGSAPNSFKGFADSTSTNPPACGGTWTSDAGNSSGPPAAIGPDITVIVASSVMKSGSTIAGNSPELVVVHVDPGYAPNPGHPGTGTVTSVICH